MAWNPAILAATTLGTTEEVIYVATGPTIVKLVLAHNITGGAVTATISIRKSGASAALRAYSQSVAGNATVEPLSGRTFCMANGDAIYGLAGAVSSITCIVSGVTQ